MLSLQLGVFVPASLLLNREFLASLVHARTLSTGFWAFLLLLMSEVCCRLSQTSLAYWADLVFSSVRVSDAIQSCDLQ